MNPNWEFCGRIPSGGTVLHLVSAADGSLWVASPAGLFAQRTGNWRPVTHGFPFGGTSTVLAIQNSIFAAGLPHGLVRSPDYGHTWHKCWTDQTEAPITCFAASPNFNRDRVILAGTDGDGVLRSTDGGRFWQLENFGLRSFSVLSLVSAPSWGRREILFAGTDAGIFQTPNGGRAWRQIGDTLGDKKVSALLISPNFSEDQTIFAGTEDHGLFQSIDGGWHWSPVPLSPINPKSVNCLQLIGPGALLVGTGSDGILRANIKDSTCETVAPLSSAVFCFSEFKQHLIAGISDNGLLRSTDGGKTWAPEPNLSARHFNDLAVADEHTLIAAGISEGLWISPSTGTHWEKTAANLEDLIPLDITIDQPCIWVSAADGVWVSKGAGDHWARALPSERPITTITSATGRVWAMTRSGQGWTSFDEGRNWQQSKIPIGAANLVAFAASPDFHEDHTLLAAAIDPIKNRIQVWRSTDEGDNWELWLDEKTDWQAALFAASGFKGESTILALGTKLVSRSAGNWKIEEITTAEAPITALLSTADQIFAAVAGDLLVSSGGTAWETFSHGLKGASIVSLERSPTFSEDFTIWGLTREGELWKRILS